MKIIQLMFQSSLNKSCNQNFNIKISIIELPSNWSQLCFYITKIHILPTVRDHGPDTGITLTHTLKDSRLALNLSNVPYGIPSLTSSSAQARNIFVIILKTKRVIKTNFCRSIQCYYYKIKIENITFNSFSYETATILTRRNINDIKIVNIYFMSAVSYVYLSLCTLNLHITVSCTMTFNRFIMFRSSS